MNLSPAPTKTPLNEELLNPPNWQWQRWYSDLYEKIKELEDRIRVLEKK